MADTYSKQLHEDFEYLAETLNIPHEVKWDRVWVSDDVYKAIEMYEQGNGFAGMTLEEYLIRMGHGSLAND